MSSDTRKLPWSLPSIGIAEFFAFFVALVVSAAVITWSEKNDFEKHRLQVLGLAGAKAHEIESAIKQPLAATTSLAALVRQGDGRVDDFDTLAAEMLHFYPGADSLQLAPGGVIRHVVPLQGNERAIGHDLLADMARNKEAIQARKTGRLTLAGPFDLLQGGLGAVGRMPVFLDDGDSSRFWGFTAVLIRFPEVLDTAKLHTLKDQGMSYELWRTHPDTGKRQVIMASAASMPADAVEYSLQVPNGTWVLNVAPDGGWTDPLQLAAKVVLGLIFSVMLAWIVRQMNALKRSHAETSALLKRQHAILASAADGVYGTDAAGRLMFINPAALEKLGYAEHEVLGRSAHSLLHHHHPDGREYPAEDCPIVQSRLTQRATKRDDEVFFDKDGKAFPVEYAAAPFVDENERIGGVVIFRDVTIRREHERQLQDSVARLKESNQQLSEAKDQLVQAEKLAAIGQLAAGVAHEINNPIGFVTSNFATLDQYHKDIFELIDRYESLIREAGITDVDEQAATLREKADIGFVREDVATMATETREGLARVKRIVRDLLDFSRVEFDAEQHETDLTKILESTLNIAHNAIASKAKVVRDYGEIPRVFCNEGQLQQVFMNLVMNAAQAIDRQGTITLGTRTVDDEVCIEVSDTGCGMDADAVARMFDPFYTTKPIGKGTGLGLSVSYSIVQKHGGRFEVDSIPGRGTHVRVYLPITPCSARQTAPATETVTPVH